MRLPPVSVLLLFYASVISAVGVLPPFSRLEVPFAHVALSGDLHVSLHSPPAILPPLLLSVSRLESGITHFLADVILPQTHNTDQNITQFTIPCGYFTKGGTYLLRIRGADENLTEAEAVQDSKLSGVLDVRWPSPKLSLTPENIQTFPEHSVTGIIEFPEVMCTPLLSESILQHDSILPEFWLELSFCGEGSHGGTALCSGPGAPLYSEQVRGLPGRREVSLRCELFGMAGTYALVLRPAIPTPTLATSTAYLKARWSEQFVLNVHARSVLPCDAHAGGVAALVQYPACVLERADRVRVFAREPSPLHSPLHSPLPAALPLNSQLESSMELQDSVPSPAELRYVAELRVPRGAHALRFPCDLFTERYPEYCFVYVSQAVTGAVADVRRECLPTLPLPDGALAAGWGPWSAWSPCSGKCGGARARYRYCDSPPPPYGSSYCKGPAVESEPCGSGEGSGNGAGCPWEADADLGGPCKCGCVLRLGGTKRKLAASAQACKGRTFWLMQASRGHVVKLQIERYRLPCGAQWLKARDGGTPGAELLAEWPVDMEAGGDIKVEITSSGPDLLLEFFSDELLAAGSACPGGFVAMAEQIEPVAANASASLSAIAGTPRLGGRGMGGAALLATLIAVAALLTGPAACWLVMRALHATRKYQRANDCDSLADSDVAQGSAAALGGSRGTLLSEVLSLRRLRAAGGGGGGAGHRLLRESRDLDETPNIAPANGDETNAGGWSSGSSVTLAAVAVSGNTAQKGTSRPVSGGSLPAPSTTSTDGQQQHSSPLRRSRTCSPARNPHLTNPHSMISDGDSPSMSVDMSTSERDSDNSSDIRDSRRVSEASRFQRRTTVSENGSRCESVSTLTNGCYSPALSATSCARVRATGGKERKERRNLRLRAPPSDLSLAAPDFELDYYDYNVTNAGCVPGSYLGMDPAFLVWIPPLHEDDEKPYHTYEEILPRPNLDPGSNTESPEDFHDNPTLPRERLRSEEETPMSSPKFNRNLLTKTNIVHPLNYSISDLSPSKNEPPIIESNKLFYPRRETKRYVSIPMKELSTSNKLQNVSAGGEYLSDEKETMCEKSPTPRRVDVTEIQFADEDSDSSNDRKFDNGIDGSDNRSTSNKFLKT